MPKPFPMQSLLDLAERRSEAAAIELGKLNAQGLDLERQLAQLLRFREEYDARLRTAARGGLPHAAWSNYHEFLARLDAAIALQRSALEQSRSRTAAGRRRWEAAQRSVLTYGVLSERHDSAQRAHERRREQKEQDERAAARQAARQRRYAL